MEALGMKEAIKECWEKPTLDGNIDIAMDVDEDETTPLGDEDIVLEELYNEQSMNKIESDIIKLKEVKAINDSLSNKILEKRKKFKRIPSIDLPLYTACEGDITPHQEKTSPFVTIQHNGEHMYVRKTLLCGC